MKMKNKNKNKSAKISPRAQKSKLVGYDGHRIYRIFLEKNYKVIQVKDLRIYKDTRSKNNTEILFFDAIALGEKGGNSFDISFEKTCWAISPPSADLPVKKKRGRPRKKNIKERLKKILFKRYLLDSRL